MKIDLTEHRSPSLTRLSDLCRYCETKHQSLLLHILNAPYESQPEYCKSQSVSQYQQVTGRHMHSYLYYYCWHRLWTVISLCLLRQTTDIHATYTRHKATNVPLLSAS